MRINKANPWRRDGSLQSVLAIAAVGIVMGFWPGGEVAAQTPNPLETSLHAVSRRTGHQQSPREHQPG